jgi:hypothetical protein
MRDTSRRADGRVTRGGAPNALFLCGPAHHLLAALPGQVDEVRIVLPWADLLRAVLTGERAFALAVAGSL